MLTQKEKDWVEKSIEKEITPFQVGRLLQNKGFEQKKIEEMLEFYNKLVKELTKKKEVEVIGKKEEKENKELETAYGKYITEQRQNMTKRELKLVKKYLKKIQKYSKVLRVGMIGLRKEVESLKQVYGKDKKRLDEELKWLKEDLITKMIDSKEVVDFNDPNTGEEATEESLRNCDLNTLMDLMDEIIEVLPYKFDEEKKKR